MTAVSSPCDPAGLQLLAEDRLDPEQIARMEQHLEQCSICRDSFDRLLGDENWLCDVRRHLGSDSPDYIGDETEFQESLDFLTPSDWPDSLGRLGSYEIKGVLGRGGMGVVLKAFDPVLRRCVAIKVLSVALATSGAARRRFLREARAAAAVVHPHVVAVHAVVESTGLPFIVMEYVPGRSLQERLDRHGALPLAEILRIGMQTAAGLAAAHAQGLVHRDVKPANILLEEDVERVRLTDFGLARAAADAAMTRSGVVAGTPHYMAPEQARGETTDQRADLFSLGSTLYVMCAGHPPFRAETPLAVLKRVCDNEARPLRDITPEVPLWLDAIIRKLMAKDAGRRFQTASEVSDLLRDCLAHVQQPTVVPLPDQAAQAVEAAEKKSVWHSRRWVRGAALVAMLTLSLGAIGFWSWRTRDVVRPEVDQVGAIADGRGPEADPLAALNELQQSPKRSAWIDEIEKEITDARSRASAIDMQLHRDEAAVNDHVSNLIRELRERAQAVESEMSLGTPNVSTNRLPFNSNDRR